MLNEKYINALSGLKSQGSASHLFAGCDAEAQHIYRIVMAEGIPVDQLDEAMLAKFINQESAGAADYSGYADRDGLKYVDLEKDVEIYPSTKIGATTYPIEGQSYQLSSHEVKGMLIQLYQRGQLRMITGTMQSLAERVDGTKLQTAFPSLQEVNECTSKGLVLPDSLLEKLKEWEALGAAEINFDFVEQV